MSLQYVGDKAVIQVKPPAWSKHYAGEPDSCSLTFQGAQYLIKAFLDALTPFQALVYTDEFGNGPYTESGMFLSDWTTDDNPILPTATLIYTGIRDGETSVMPTDDITIQTASTSKAITDSTSDNFEKTINLSVTYRAARTSYKWVALANPGATPTYSSVRKQITTALNTNGIIKRFSGMVDEDGNPTTTISTGDATAVWNTFTARTQVSSFTVTEVVPGCVYQCESVNDWLLEGV